MIKFFLIVIILGVLGMGYLELTKEPRTLEENKNWVSK